MAARALRPLPPGEVHLDWVRAPPKLDPALERDYLALLNDAERARHDRFHFERTRHEFLVTRALVRTTLSRYADVEPAAWSFKANAWGRPEIDAPGAHARLGFNLTNTEGLVAIVVADAREVGCDVEDVNRRGETVAIANRFFSAREVEDLGRVPAAEQRARFFDYWTLKEAYIKARGMGLAIPLGDFSFVIRRGAPIAIEFAPALEDDPSSWQFEQLRPTERHVLSVAIRRRDEPDLRLVVREAFPLVREA
ncbi:MAG TPA: 4'-phosphopantetheinyl transferase superfamily protein [Minicystis sp.]|nr:4'-phosphopantetheinyl transferase superfamily protein [Minicystis sp.]